MQGASAEVVSDGDQARDLAAQLLETAPLVMRTIRALMRAHLGADLSVPQFRALSYVGRHPDTSLSADAEHLGLSVAASSRLVDALVVRGLVARATARTDRRLLTLRLQSDGEALLAATRERALEALTTLLRPLDAADRDALIGALPALRAVFSTPAAPVRPSHQPSDQPRERTP